MTLQDEMVQSGSRLFKWRSYAPLLTGGLFALGFVSFHYPFGSHPLDEMWEVLCLAVAFAGLGIRALTVGFVPSGTSGRNIARMKAERLNTTGIYSLMRHPLYVGNFIIFMGITLFFRQWYVTAIAALVYWMYYERIMLAEEDYLRDRFGAEFDAWAARTGTVFPRWRSWRRPDLPFSFRTVLRREYTTFFAIVATLTALELIEHLITEHRFQFDAMWIAIFFPTLAIYLILSALKHRTRLLHVVGR